MSGARVATSPIARPTQEETDSGATSLLPEARGKDHLPRLRPLRHGTAEVQGWSVHPSLLIALLVVNYILVD